MIAHEIREIYERKIKKYIFRLFRVFRGPVKIEDKIWDEAFS